MNNQQYAEFQKRMNVMTELIKYYDIDKYFDLIRQVPLWSKEDRPLKYSNWVNENYEIDPDNMESLCIYALLTNTTPTKLREDLLFNYDIKKR